MAWPLHRYDFRKQYLQCISPISTPRLWIILPPTPHVSKMTLNYSVSRHVYIMTDYNVNNLSLATRTSLNYHSPEINFDKLTLHHRTVPVTTTVPKVGCCNYSKFCPMPLSVLWAQMLWCLKQHSTLDVSKTTLNHVSWFWQRQARPQRLN